MWAEKYALLMALTAFFFLILAFICGGRGRIASKRVSHFTSTFSRNNLKFPINIWINGLL